MSFGIGIGDIALVLKTCAQAYESWNSACGKYSQVTTDLESLVILLRQIQSEASNPNSVIFKQNDNGKELQTMISNCRDIVIELREIVVKYKGLGRSRAKNWDRLKLGYKDLGPLRERLVLQISAISAYMSTIGVGSLGRIEETVDTLHAMKSVIDGIASEIRAGKREESVMTTHSNDDKEVWRQFRRELLGEGFTSEDIQRHSSHLKSHLRRLRREGLLEEDEPAEEPVPDSGSAAPSVSVSQSLLIIRADPKVENIRIPLTPDVQAKVEECCRNSIPNSDYEHIDNDDDRASVSSSGSSELDEKSWPRSGKTRMPPSLADMRAIIDLGYPFELEVSTPLLLIRILAYSSRAKQLSS
jgi:hypothetical protein